MNGAGMDRDLRTVLSDAAGGHRISEQDALALFMTRGRDLWKIVAAADEKREKVAGDAVTYVRNQNINVTNLCVNACGFCGFSKKPGDEGIYFHDEAVIREKARLAKSRGSIRDLHGERSPPGLYRTVLYRCLPLDLRGSPGGAPAREQPDGGCVRGAAKRHEHKGRARSDERGGSPLDVWDGRGDPCGFFREKICPQRSRPPSGSRIIREAHGLGIPTTATIMYGHCESDADRVRHLAILREIQDETHGFTEFVRSRLST